MEKTAASSRYSPVVASWLVALGFVGLLVLLFWPAPKDPPPATRPVIEHPPSELTKVGLPDDPDLEGLPGFFAVWADYAEWKDNKTIFAYRHPVSGEFSFFFEATRTAEGYRFRSISPPAHLVVTEFPEKESPVRFLGEVIDGTVPVSRYQKPRQDRRVPKAAPVPVSLEAPPAELGAPVPPTPPKPEPTRE